MAKTIAGLNPNAVLIPALVDFQDADGHWDRTDPESGHVAQESASSVAKASRWENLAGKTIQKVTVEDGVTKAFPLEKAPAGVTGPTYPRARWANGTYVYEVPA